MNDVMHIAVAANQAFARYLCVMLTSLLENNRSGKLRLYLLSADIDRGGKMDAAHRRAGHRVWTAVSVS